MHARGNTPVGGNTSNAAGARTATHAPSALQGNPKLPTDPPADMPNFVGNGHFGSGYGRPDASREAWAASTRQREHLAATSIGATPRMDLHRPVGITVGEQQSTQDGNHHIDDEPAPPARRQYQNNRGYDMASGDTRPHHHKDKLAGGCITSPRHADWRRQAMANRISLLDIAGLGDMKYHGGDNGYVPLTMKIVH
jgi:hypothetical protein